MKTKYQILEWLKAQKWYELFKQETERVNKVSIEEYVESSDRTKNLIIIGAFNWNGTPEGRYFWNEAHNNYLNFLYN